MQYSTIYGKKDFRTIKLTGDEYDRKRTAELLVLLIDNLSLSVVIGKNRYDLTYTDGKQFGIHGTEVFYISSYHEVPKHFTDDDDDEPNYSNRVKSPALSPLDYEKALRKFQTFIKNEREGKKTKFTVIKPYEWDKIIDTMNKPIGDAE